MEAWYRPLGRYGWNRATLADERARNRQRKARPEAPDGRGGYKRKRRSDRSGARSRIGARDSGTGSEQKAPDRCQTSSDAGRIQKTDRRGKAPCCVAASTNDARVSTWRKGGQVRNAKDPAPASRRPARRPQTLGDRKSRSSPVKGDDHTGKRLAGKPHEPFERADGGRATARPPPTLQELVEAALGMAVDNAVDHVGQIGLRLDADQLAGLNQGRNHRPVRRPTVRAGKQRIQSISTRPSAR